jgi:hypothetical protein
MFIEDDSAREYVRAEVIALPSPTRRELYLERLAVAALNALAAADALSYDELVERVKGWS